MQKTDIEWCDATWNPVTGCNNSCAYCYARSVARRFGGWTKSGEKTTESPLSTHPVLDAPLHLQHKNGKVTVAPFPFGFTPTFHRYRLDDPQKVKEPQNIFVCSMSDLFGPWVPWQWIVQVFDACRRAPQHRYLFLTKFPQRYIDLHEVALLPQEDNFMFGSTITNQGTDRMFWAEDYHTFASIEPILEPFTVPEENQLQYMDWIIVGAETGNRKGKVVPERNWLDGIIHCCDEIGIPIMMKDSLIPIMGEDNMRRQFPWN